MNLLYWLEPWEPSPTVVIAIAVAAVLFVRGQRKARVSFARRFSFWLGLTGLYVALHTRLDYFFEHEFFMHRAQHLVLHHLGPFFIALAYPGAALRAGIPFAWRQVDQNWWSAVSGFSSLIPSLAEACSMAAVCLTSAAMASRTICWPALLSAAIS